MDTMSMLTMFGESFPELLCGGRHSIYLMKWEKLLVCLRDEFGAELVIVCDGRRTYTFGQNRNLV